MYENECDAMDKFMHEMCGPRFNYDGADLVSPEDGDEAEEDGVEHGSVKKKFVRRRQGKKKAKAPTSDMFTKTLELVAKKFQEELAAVRASADAQTEAMVLVLERLASSSQGASSSQMTSKAKVVVVDETSSNESPLPKRVRRSSQ